MRGRSGVLYTGHCLRDTSTGQVAAATASTTVFFADVSDAEIETYVNTGEPLYAEGPDSRAELYRSGRDV